MPPIIAYRNQEHRNRLENEQMERLKLQVLLSEQGDLSMRNRFILDQPSTIPRPFSEDVIRDRALELLKRFMRPSEVSSAFASLQSKDQLRDFVESSEILIDKKLRGRVDTTASEFESIWNDFFKKSVKDEDKEDDKQQPPSFPQSIPSSSFQPSDPRFQPTDPRYLPPSPSPSIPSSSRIEELNQELRALDNMNMAILRMTMEKYGLQSPPRASKAILRDLISNEINLLLRQEARKGLKPTPPKALPPTPQLSPYETMMEDIRGRRMTGDSPLGSPFGGGFKIGYLDPFLVRGSIEAGNTNRALRHIANIMY
jgi:hypothetical protein